MESLYFLSENSPLTYLGVRMGKDRGLSSSKADPVEEETQVVEEGSTDWDYH